MEKEFVPYEQALALKELGFDEPYLDFYDDTKELFYNHENKEKIHIGDSVKAPLYQQAFRWFREKHRLQAEILWRGDMGCFCYKIGNFKYGEHTFSEKDYKTYEEAELECLKKLIQIVKEQK